MARINYNNIRCVAFARTLASSSAHPPMWRHFLNQKQRKLSHHFDSLIRSTPSKRRLVHVAYILNGLYSFYMKFGLI